MPGTVDDYIAGLSDWQAELAATLRGQILAAGDLNEAFKWGQPVYATGKGPVCFLKSGKADLLLGFWRGQQMTELDPRLAPFGSFRMAGIKLAGQGEIDEAQVRRLVVTGIALNERHGDPMKEAKVK